MKKVAYAVALSAALICSSCSGSNGAGSGSEPTGSAVAVPADGSYSASATDELIQMAQDGKELTQDDYAAVIGQCSAINRKLVEKLRQVDFKSGMTTEEIEAAMSRLQNDSTLPRLEAQNRELLVILQNADLDTANTRRYDAMVEEVRRSLQK